MNVGLLAAFGVLVESQTQGFDGSWYVDGLKIVGNWNVTRLSKCKKNFLGPTLKLGGTEKIVRRNLHGSRISDLS